MTRTMGEGEPESTAGLDWRTLKLVYPPLAFSRLDEDDDASFYETDRLVDHLDRDALATVSRLIGSLAIERRPRILDLMASWDSHLPTDLAADRVVGLGLNARELAANTRLDERVVHDLNATPSLPFPPDSFDVVLNTVSVDYMTRPFEVFAEVARVLVPGGLFLVIFSNRMFPRKAIRLWRQSSEPERVLIVEDYFRASRRFTEPRTYVATGRPRPPDDRHAAPGVLGDPVYAIWAERRGGIRPCRPLPDLETAAPDPERRAEIERRKLSVPQTLCCPHCDERLSKWVVPQTPFTELAAEFLRVCFNDECPYLRAGWDTMVAQGNLGFSHRFSYDPESGRCGCLPVPGIDALKSSIVED